MINVWYTKNIMAVNYTKHKHNFNKKKNNNPPKDLFIVHADCLCFYLLIDMYTK